MEQVEGQNVVDLHKLEGEYQKIKPFAESTCVSLVKQIGNLIEGSDVILGLPIQMRIKSWTSLIEKINRVGLNVRKIRDVQDLIGLRVVVLFNHDIEKVAKFISQNFNAKRKNNNQQADQFGYTSVHLILDISEEQDALQPPSRSRLNKVKAEVQIRTLAQHTWAEVSHKLQYKQEKDVTREMRRAISRMSALLEIVDLEFERLRERRENYRSNVDISGTQEDLNVDLLEKTLDDLLPRQNKQANEQYANLLDKLRLFSVITQQDLVRLVKENLDMALVDEKKQVEEEIRLLDSDGFSLAEPERLANGIYYNHVGLIEIMLKIAGSPR